MPGRRGLSKTIQCIGKWIRTAPDFNHLIQGIISELVEAVGSQTALLCEHQGDRWVISHVHGLPQEAVGTFVSEDRQPHAILDSEVKEPTVIRNVLTDRRVNLQHMGKWGVRSVLAVPLVIQDQTIAVLFLNQHKEGLSFRRSQVDAADQLARYLSLAVCNARFREDLRAGPAGREETEQALQEAGAQLQIQNEELRVQAEELRSQTQELADTNRQLRDSERALRELNVSLEDKVTQRTRELEHRARQLAKLTLELSQAEQRERRRVAAILHEELQQQIAGAKFHLNALKDQGTLDVQEAVRRIDEVLRDVIKKSRRLSHDLSPAVLHMNDLGDVLQWLAQRMQAQHNLTIHVEVAGEMVLQSEAMTMFLFRAAQELLFNVVRHAHAMEAAVRVRRIGRDVCLSVSDRGRGFDPGVLEETTGLGLLSLRERAELFGGRMEIESTPSRGSTVCVIVPDGTPADRAGTTAGGAGRVRRNGPEGQESTATAGRRCLRVLVADDHEIVRQGLIAVLKEESDVEVVGEAANGREAVDLAVRLDPDVILMDVAMPMVNGEKATRQIKGRLPEVRVIALSMCDDPQTIERMRQAGAEAYVLKTAPFEELLTTIRGRESDP